MASLLCGFYLLWAYEEYQTLFVGVIANLFYVEKSYTLNQIATFSKFWGLLATLLGDPRRNFIFKI